MSDFPTPILLATDGSPGASLASRAAVDLSVRSGGSELRVVHAWQAPTQSTYVPTTEVDYPLLHELLARELLEEQVERLEALGATVVRSHLRRGSPAEEIIGLSEELEAGLVVVGSRGLGAIAQLALGSVSEKIAYLASSPTLVVRGQAGAWPPAVVVVGDDSSEEAEKAAEIAVSIAKLFEAHVVLVRTAYPEPQLVPPEYPWASYRTQRERAVLARMQEKRLIKGDLERRADELQQTLGRRPRVRASVGDAAAFLLEVTAESEGSSLVAIGSRGMGAVKSVLLGSVSRKVLRGASGSVLIAR